MAKIDGFQGVFYNPEKISDLSLVTTPPYDVIAKEGQDSFYDKSPYNVIRLILGKEYPNDSESNNRYTRAASDFKDFLKERVLEKKDNKALYLYSQTYDCEGERKVRKGFISLVKLEPFEKKIVLPHEKTHQKAKTDRLNLLRETKVNFEQIFGLYDDETKLLEEKFDQVGESFISFTDEMGILHQVFELKEVSEVAEMMQDKTILIADGHHRYSASLLYQQERGAGDGRYPWDWVPIYLAPMNQEGLSILPIHRLIKGISCEKIERLKELVEPYFMWEELSSLGEFLKRRAYHIFGLYYDNKFVLLSLKKGIDLSFLKKDDIPSEWLSLDVGLVQLLLISEILGITKELLHSEEAVSYETNPQKMMEKVDQKEAQLGILLHPTSVRDIKRVAEACQVMPQKSTFFYPKLLTGLIMREM